MVCVLLETSSKESSLALYNLDKKSKLLALEEWDSPSTSAFITVAFEKALKKARLSISSLEAIALGVGPGRFTGTRIGVSFVKTIAFTTSIPIYPFSSLSILAATASIQKEPAYILTLVNAFKNSIFLSLHLKDKYQIKEITAPKVLPVGNTLKKYLDSNINSSCFCVGDALVAYETFWKENWKTQYTALHSVFPHTRGLVKLFKEKVHNIKPTAWQALNPLYLRSPVSTLEVNSNAKK